MKKGGNSWRGLSCKECCKSALALGSSNSTRKRGPRLIRAAKKLVDARRLVDARSVRTQEVR